MGGGGRLAPFTPSPARQFLPAAVIDGDSYLSLDAGQAWAAPMDGAAAAPRGGSGGGVVADVLVEASVWLSTAASSVTITVRAGPVPEAALVQRDVAVRHGAGVASPPQRSRRSPPSPAAAASHAHAPAPPAPAAVSAANCSSGALMHDTDVCPGGPPGYVDLDLSTEPDPLAACAAACCGWLPCTAWIVRNFSGTDGNCSGSGVTCCWLKPGCSEVRGGIHGAAAPPP